MASWRLLGLSATLALTTVTTTTGFAPAVHRAGAPRACAVVADHHRVLSRTCADSADAPALRAVRADNTLLVTLYQDAGFEGQQTSLYGRSGSCDSQGYSFGDLTDANSQVNGVSSYRVYNNCGASSTFTGTGFSGQGSGVNHGDQGYVGDQWNDNVYSMKVWNG